MGSSLVAAEATCTEPFKEERKKGVLYLVPDLAHIRYSLTPPAAYLALLHCDV